MVYSGTMTNTTQLKTVKLSKDDWDLVRIAMAVLANQQDLQGDKETTHDLEVLIERMARQVEA